MTNADGLYRAVLLPLGRYRVVAEMQGFKRFEQIGITLPAGEARVVNATLGVGAGQRDGDGQHRQLPVLNAGKIDAGRNHERDRSQEPAAVVAQSLQLRARAAGHHRLREHRVRRAPSRRQRHADAHQLPDRRQHQHREGSRRPAAAADVRGDGQRGEGGDHRLRPGVRSDHGDGLQRDHAVGHQQTHGDASYLFRRKSFSAFPFPFTRPETPANKPDTKVDTVTGTLGGPIIKSKLLYYVGYERTSRDLSAQRVITIPQDAVAALGLTAAAERPFRRPGRQVLHRQGRLSGERGEPLHRPLSDVPQRLAVQRQRRRHPVARLGDRFPRRHGLDRRPAGHDDRQRHVERGARAVRASSPELACQRRHRHRTGDHGPGRRQLRRRASAAPDRTTTGSTSSRTSCR